jgi:hypothetical protein
MYCVGRKRKTPAAQIGAHLYHLGWLIDIVGFGALRRRSSAVDSASYLVELNSSAVYFFACVL